MKPLTTPGGRTFIVLGDPSVITMDRLPTVSARLDSDPRIASVSVVAHPNPTTEFLRATAPAGCVVLAATDIDALTGPLTARADATAVTEWARRASERGLWHDWWLSSSRDVSNAAEYIAPAELDVRESVDLTSSHYPALNDRMLDPNAISMTINATWLGPHQTGAQVLTTAAIEALVRNPRIDRIHLIGIEQLPEYAAHLIDDPKVNIGLAADPTNVIWYPNQIDQRVDISQARSLAQRVITTYLDLIAYDIPRYHASSEAWAAYRSLQRRSALSVDGITTISSDVATRLMEEVPRLEHERVQPIPLGLDHIDTVAIEAGEDIEELRRSLGARPFVLVLGNDFHHKNRDFAIEVWEAVLENGVNCDLVLAGLHVKSSSSQEREDALLSQHTNLRGTAHSAAHVSPQSREWLLANAAAVLYPSSAEGFGFVPYEAAALGTPSTFAGFGPLAEISQVKDVPGAWTTQAFSADLADLLTDPERAQRRVSDLRQAITRSSWDGFAQSLIDFIVRIHAMPPVAAALVGASAADASALAAVLSSKTWRATASLRRVGNRIRGSR